MYIGGDVTNLAAIQTGLTTVQVTWTAPPGTPVLYQIMVDAPDVNIDTTATESPYSLTTSELGVHSIQVLYTSQHLPNEQAMPVEVTLEGKGEGYHIECHGTVYIIQQVSEEQLSLHYH